MKSEQIMMKLIMEKAMEDERIRAVVLNGSRVNPNIIPDRFQDYDIVYYVKDISSFTSDHTWVDRFGERLIMQLPDENGLYPEDTDHEDRFAYLMQFKDGNRIDLTLKSVDSITDTFDSLSRVLLDKDGQIPDLPAPNDSDYHINKPTEIEMAACSNEFWWVSTYVAKGLWRRELPYAKSMMEGPVRRMLIRLLGWHVSSERDFQLSIGAEGKHLEKYMESRLWEQYIRTYANGLYEEMWSSLFEMSDLFSNITRKLNQTLNYSVPVETEVYHYLKSVYASTKDHHDKITNLTHMRLLVDHYEDCFAFYHNTLGFPVLWGDEKSNYADFKAQGDVKLAIFDRKQMDAAINQIHFDRTKQDHMSLIFRVADVSAVYEHWKDKVNFISEPTIQKEWGIKTVHLRDPEGNLIELNEPIKQAIQ